MSSFVLPLNRLLNHVAIPFGERAVAFVILPTFALLIAVSLRFQNGLNGRFWRWC